MKTVHQVSELSGVSIRALHHYDAIGLLKPTLITEKGYRLYDGYAIERLQTILLFKELQFPLKEIKGIIDSPNFDRKKALEQQIELLRLKRARISEIIDLAENTVKGVNTMDFKAFDTSKIKAFEKEAKEKWGNTPQYGEYEEKSSKKAESRKLDETEGLMGVFAEIGKIKDLPPESEKVQTAVKSLMDFITENYYTCTPQILSSLGQMYVADNRFKENIDSVGGVGTAEFVSKAIAIFVTD